MNRILMTMMTCLILAGCGGMTKQPKPYPADQAKIELPDKSLLMMPVPSSLPVYQAPFTPITREQAKARAALFELSASSSIEEGTETIFVKQGDKACEIDALTGSVYYQDNAGLQATGSDVVLPDLAKNKQTAQDYLKRFGLGEPGTPEIFHVEEYPGEAGKVVQREIEYRRLLEERFAVGKGSEFSVIIGSGGKVVECFLDWPALQAGKSVKLQSPEAALTTLPQRLKEIAALDPKHPYRSFRITGLKLLYYGQYTASNQREVIPVYGVKGIADRGEGAFENTVILTASQEAPILPFSYDDEIRLPD